MMMNGVHIMVKPIGPICNLNCDYCFYLEKENLYPNSKQFKMTDAILERYIQQHIDAQPQDAKFYSFSWQGGEPTIMGIDFFRKAVSLQKKYAKGLPCENTFQTNGISLNDEWCNFFYKENFLVGISIDGNSQHHDIFRKTRSRKGTHQTVLRAIRLLQKHKILFNALVVLHKYNIDDILGVYRYLKSLGIDYMQFTPLVERIAQKKNLDNLYLVHPDFNDETNIAPWSISSEQYGKALVSLFDEWVKYDLGKIFINTFETTLGLAIGEPSNSCIFAKTCGSAIALEHNGDVYSCDHFVYPQNKIGNINQSPIKSMVSNEIQRNFGDSKLKNLSIECKGCCYYYLCHGGCPKHRFSLSKNGKTNKNYFCEGYKYYFDYTLPYFKLIYDGLRKGKTIEETKNIIQERLN